jgi:hypothetical protein
MHVTATATVRQGNSNAGKMTSPKTQNEKDALQTLGVSVYCAHLKYVTP